MSAILKNAVGTGDLAHLDDRLHRALERAVELTDERGVDPLWTGARAHLRDYALRPGKRTRPLLTVIGYGLATGQGELGDGIIDAAAALELLHTFLLIHDDVADRAPTRRGGPSLHLTLGRGKLGEDLAIVMGDHLFARSVELLLQGRLPHSAEAVSFLMQACRFTAAGQFLDLQLSLAPLAEVTLFQTLKVAHLKTARYGFVAPLLCGAILGGGSAELRETLERVGRHAGTAYQLRDDLIGLFGEDAASGKSCASDYFEGKRTFPLIAAYARATDRGRRELEALWDLPHKDERDLEEARHCIEQFGGREATERLIDRVTRSARRALAALPAPQSSAHTLLDGLLTHLSQRSA
jgi:geranylgeranyl diphosphate synthase type I